MAPQTWDGSKPYRGDPARWRKVREDLTVLGYEVLSEPGEPPVLPVGTWEHLTARLQGFAQLHPDCTCPDGLVDARCPRHGRIGQFGLADVIALHGDLPAASPDL